MIWDKLIRNPNESTNLSFSDLAELVGEALKTLSSESPVIEANADKAIMVGDTHGDFESTKIVVKRFLDKYDKLIFLGDYVDRGYEQIGNINYLLSLKIAMPEKIILLRGNHETPIANMYYGFKEQACLKYGLEGYQLYSTLFSQLSFIVILNGDVVILHGGVPNPIPNINTLRNMRKGLIDLDERHAVEFQLLWNDPREEVKGFTHSFRGPGIFYFGEDVFKEFMERNGFKLMVRAHEVFENGFKYFFNKKLLSIFSAKWYGFPINAKVAEYSSRGLKILSF